MNFESWVLLKFKNRLFQYLKSIFFKYKKLFTNNWFISFNFTENVTGCYQIPFFIIPFLDCSFFHCRGERGHSNFIMSGVGFSCILSLGLCLLWSLCWWSLNRRNFIFFTNLKIFKFFDILFFVAGYGYCLSEDNILCACWE